MLIAAVQGGFWRRQHPGGYGGPVQARAPAGKGCVGVGVQPRVPTRYPLSECRVFPRGMAQERAVGTRVRQVDRATMYGAGCRAEFQAPPAGAGGAPVPPGAPQRGCSGGWGGGAARPTPRRTVSTCARRTTTSVPRAGTAGSSSAATAAPGPSTWPACPHHCSRSPAGPGGAPAASREESGGTCPWLRSPSPRSDLQRPRSSWD